MGLFEERLQVLKMVEEGKVSVEEAAKLLEAMETPAPAQGRTAGFLRIEVTEAGKKKANIKIPAALINLAVSLGQRFLPAKIKELEGVDFPAILEAVRQGARGKILEVEEEEKQTRVEIFLE
ncbi:MAG: hypothetical protein M1553_08020 [Firmicutes bacterium]|nr:hypothetical protein [Bacillota bacterium]